MNPELMRAVVVVTCALIFYSAGIIFEQRNKAINKRILFYLTVGVTLDITSTVMMIFGSSNTPLTFHGILGYSALLLMLIVAVLVWRFWLKSGSAAVPHKLHLYTRIAYGWWVIAYIAGAIIAAVL